jgi:hypothetical protein
MRSSHNRKWREGEEGKARECPTPARHNALTNTPTLRPFAGRAVTPTVLRREYGRLKRNSCCCAQCRDLGYFAFDMIRILVRILYNLLPTAPSWCSEKEMLRRVDEAERRALPVRPVRLAFRRGKLCAGALPTAPARASERWAVLLPVQPPARRRRHTSQPRAARRIHFAFRAQRSRQLRLGRCVLPLL